MKKVFLIVSCVVTLITVLTVSCFAVVTPGLYFYDPDIISYDSTIYVNYNLDDDLGSDYTLSYPFSDDPIIIDLVSYRVISGLGYDSHPSIYVWTNGNFEDGFYSPYWTFDSSLNIYYNDGSDEDNYPGNINIGPTTVNMGYDPVADDFIMDGLVVIITHDYNQLLSLIDDYNAGVLGDIVDSFTSGFGIVGDFGQMIQDTFTSVFITTDSNGNFTGLSAFGSISLCLVGIAIVCGLGMLIFRRFFKRS